MSQREELEGIVLVPEDSEQTLNQRQLEDYRGFREDLVRWILNLGKDPEKAESYAWDTARQRSYRIDKFYRWIWNQRDGYTLNAKPEDAEEYSRELAYKGTYMARDNGLAAAQAQLRHKSERTTMRYDQAPVEDRKKTLNNWD